MVEDTYSANVEASSGSYLKALIGPAEILGAEHDARRFERLKFVEQKLGCLTEDHIVGVAEQNQLGFVVFVANEILAKNIDFLPTARCVLYISTCPRLTQPEDLNERSWCAEQE